MKKHMILGLGLAALVGLPVAADGIRLNPLFSDGAVLQRDRSVPVWGETAPNSHLSVTLAGETVYGASGRNGRFQLDLPPQPAGGPYELIVSNLSSRTAVAVRDVRLGEVWLASGQSNMEFKMMQSGQVEDFEAGCPDPSLVRMLLVEQNASGLVEDDVFTPGWKIAKGHDLQQFSAVAAWHALALQRRLGCAVGVINSSWGGTPIEAWTSRGTLEADPANAKALADYDALRRQRARWERVSLGRRQGSYFTDEQLREYYREFTHGFPSEGGFEKGWAATDFDDGAWRGFSVPGNWSRIIDGNGVVWVRKTVEIPAGWSGKALTLRTGGIDKCDVTYFNGVEVGRTGVSYDETKWNVPRAYAVPAELVRPGRAVIAIRAYSFIFDGGFVGLPRDFRLETSDGETLSLAGECRLACETNWGWARAPGDAEQLGPGHSHTPYILYDAMIRPLLPYAIRGVIWYQGEANAGDLASSAHYERQMRDLVADWRAAWADPSMPFAWVQLSSFGAEGEYVDGSCWARLRTSQARAVEATPNTGMAVSLDVGNPQDIHPHDKRTVGERLAAWALKTVYGETATPVSPTFRSMTRRGAALELVFDDGGAPLKLAEGPSGFAVSADGRTFSPAAAALDGSVIRVTSESVAAPRFVRYAWADSPTARAVSNAAGHALGTFEAGLAE